MELCSANSMVTMFSALLSSAHNPRPFARVLILLLRCTSLQQLAEDAFRLNGFLFLYGASLGSFCAAK